MKDMLLAGKQKGKLSIYTSHELCPSPTKVSFLLSITGLRASQSGDSLQPHCHIFCLPLHPCIISVSSSLHSSPDSPGPWPSSPLWSPRSWSTPAWLFPKQIWSCDASAQKHGNFSCPTEQSPVQNLYENCQSSNTCSTSHTILQPIRLLKSLVGQGFSFRLCPLLISLIGCPPQCPFSTWPSASLLKRNFGYILTIFLLKISISFLSS